MRKPKLTAEEIEAYKAEHGIAAGKRLAWLYCQNHFAHDCSRCGRKLTTNEPIVYRPAHWPEGGKRHSLCCTCADADPTVIYRVDDRIEQGFLLPRT